MDTKTPEFAWILLANLIEKYPLKKSLDICSSFLDFLSPLANYVFKGSFIKIIFNMKFFRLDSTLKVMDEVFKKIKVTFPQL